jgi:hypothetical protein
MKFISITHYDGLPITAKNICKPILEGHEGLDGITTGVSL